MFLPKICLVLSVCLVSINIFANDDKTKAAEKTPAELAIEQKYSGSQNEDWSQVQNDLSTAKQKLINEEVKLLNLQNAVQNKEKMTTAEALEINNVEKNVRKYQKEYDLKNSLYLSRYPERGLQQKRTYLRPSTEDVISDNQKSKTNDLSVDEKPQTMESQLIRLKSKIKKQYQKSTDPVHKISVKTQIASQTVEVHDLGIKDQLLMSPKLEK